MLKNTLFTYGLITRLFHWIIALAIMSMLTAGFTMTRMLSSPEKWQLYFLHKATGVIILVFVSLRFLWRLVNIEVQLPFDLPLWQKLAAKATHYLQYVFMFLMPVSGVLMCRFAGYEVNIFNLFVIPPADKNLGLANFFNNLHVISAYIFSILIGFHVSAALYHHFIRGDNILIRMIK